MGFWTMKLSPDLLRALALHESAIITDSRHGAVRGQGDVTYLFSRLRPLRFKTKRLLLVDPEGETITRCVRVTRVE